MDVSTFIPTWNQQQIRNCMYSNHTSTLFRNYVVFFGGVLNESETPIKDIFVYYIEADRGYSVQPAGDPVNSRWRHSACLYQDNKIIIFGGYTGKLAHLITEVGMLTLHEDELRAEYKILSCSNASVERARHNAHIYQDKMYIFGGVGPGDAESNTLWSLDLDALQWKSHLSSGQTPGKRKGASSVIIDDKIYLFGGASKNTDTADIWMLNLKNLQWNQIAAKNNLAHFAYGSVVEKNGNIYIFGGMQNLILRNNDVYVYNIEADKIEVLPTRGEAPNRRANHTAIYFKNRMFIFGGNCPSRSTNGSEFTLEFSDLTEEEKVITQKPRMATKKGKSENYVSVLKELYHSKLYSDITFHVQQQDITAHKNIISVRCKFFGNMLASGMSESNASKITIQDIEVPTFGALIQFIYCNEVDLNKELAIDLLKLSDKYAFFELKNICEEYLGENITIEDFVELAHIAEQLDAVILRNAIVKFVARHVDRIRLKENPGILPNSIFWEIISYLASKRP